MICANCNQETEAGEFCANCGAPLPGNESAAASADLTEGASPDVTPNADTEKTTKEGTPPNESVERLKKEASAFGNFFLTMLKKPSAAQQTNGTKLISGIISIVIFSLLISLGSYLVVSSSFLGASFLDGFLIPFIQFLVLFAVITALIFGAAKVAGQVYSFTDIVAKLGAYLVPFLVLIVIGTLLTFIQIPFTSSLIILGLLGPILFIPTFILLEQPTKGYDRIYVLLGLYLILLIVSGFLIQRILASFVGGFVGNLF